MVILIGGASCSGKTAMAQKLLEKYLINYISIDHIKMGLVRGNRYCDFTPEDPDTELTEKLWPIIHGIVMTNIENDQNIIIEGCYIPENGLLDFPMEYRKFIVMLYIGFSEQYIRNHYVNGILKHRSEIEYKDVDDYMQLDYFVKFNLQQKNRCMEAGQLFFEVNTDYVKDLQEAYDWIDRQVHKTYGMKYNKDKI